MKFSFSTKISLILLPLLLWLAVPAWGENTGDDLQLLDFVAGEEPLATTARSPRPTSKIAENVTVITSQQIAELNAHTLSEVLNTIPGIQFDRAGRTPGQLDTFSIQGATSTHILVMIDGVSQSENGQNFADLGFMPVQQIERVEIIKGGASAAWGQALGGVVNVITKSPEPDQSFSGSTFSSFGDRFTTDQRAEISGTIDRFGYYLSGGLLHSDGLLGNNGINQNNIFGKLVYHLPVKGSLTLTLGNNNSRRGIEEVPPPDDWHDNMDYKKHSTMLTFEYPLADRLRLELIGHYSYLRADNPLGYMTMPDLWRYYHTKQTDWGTKGNLIWGDSRFNLVTGLEYEQHQINQTETQTYDPTLQLDKNFNRYGSYANGTLSFGNLTILPGIRYDRVDADHNEVSYTFGTTYRLTEKSVLRAYFAQGYSRSLDVVNNVAPQKGWTVQTGIETGDVPYVWFKGTLFYNDTWNMPDSINGTGYLTSSQIRQGFEIEGRTVPLYGFSVTAGYTLVDLRDKETRIRIKRIPGDLVKLGITYDNPAWGFHGILTGNYVWWDSPPERRSEDRNFLWNLHLTQKLLPNNGSTPELFLTVWNLFNSSQYQEYQYPNAGRWLEGGVRFKF